MTYAIITFGCRVNQADSFELDAILRTCGGVAVDEAAADLVVVNTCSVTAAADQGARQAVRRIHRSNPGARILLTGCLATRTLADVNAWPEGVTVVPNDEKHIWLHVLEREGFASDAPGGCDPADPATEMVPGAHGRTAYPLRVQTGCDEACSYCIIPSTRGRSTSRTLTAILSDAARLAAAGYKEVWLVGVHLGSYGRDLRDGSSLVTLCRRLDQIQGDLTFRLGSLEPMDCPPDLIDLIARSGRFLPHLHLPLQSGSPHVLRLMRRPYTVDHYRRVVDAVVRRLPDVFLGSDIIVGFPGESAEDFAESVAEVERLPLAGLHVFPYSDRPGTEASSLPGKVGVADISRRASEMRRVARAGHAAFVRRMAGTTRAGLTLDDGTLVLTDNFLKASIPPGLPRNTRVRVTLVNGDAGLRGDLVNSDVPRVLPAESRRIVTSVG